MSKMILTENDLKNIIQESVKEILKESTLSSLVKYSSDYKQWIASEKNLLEELAELLRKNGVESAHVGAYPSGMPCLKLDTDEFHEKRVYDMAERFAKTRGRYATDDSYPATTYIRLLKTL